MVIHKTLDAQPRPCKSGRVLPHLAQSARTCIPITIGGTGGPVAIFLASPASGVATAAQQSRSGNCRMRAYMGLSRDIVSQLVSSVEPTRFGKPLVHKRLVVPGIAPGSETSQKGGESFTRTLSKKKKGEGKKCLGARVSTSSPDQAGWISYS